MSRMNLQTQLQPVRLPELYWELRNVVREGRNGEGLSAVRDEMGGFDDVIEGGLGSGLFYNTATSISQLVVALAVASNPEIAAVVETGEGGGSQAMIEQLRTRQVLNGCKILDLGAGVELGFPIAAKALGAEVHTVDGEAPRTADQDRIDGFTVTDICDEQAVERVERTSGGDFDYVTSNIIGAVPGSPRWALPGPQTLQAFSERLLSPGGYHYTVGQKLLQKVSS